MNPDLQFIERLHAMRDVIDRMNNESFVNSVASAADAVVGCLEAGNKVLICGNGGSAADAQHFAAELVGRFRLPGRKALAAIALTVDTSAITAIANDFGYEQVFSRQVAALGSRGDILICISTSGNSDNILLSARQAREMGMRTIGLTGRNGGRLVDVADNVIRVPSNETDIIQQGHLMIEHYICLEVDKAHGLEVNNENSAAR